MQRSLPRNLAILTITRGEPHHLKMQVADALVHRTTLSRGQGRGTGVDYFLPSVLAKTCPDTCQQSVVASSVTGSESIGFGEAHTGYHTSLCTIVRMWAWVVVLFR